MLPGMELMACPDLAVPLEVMQHVVRVESAHNPYAIGVVGGHLIRQPKNLPEALSTVRMLESRGFNFSLGIAQVNRYNLGKYGLDSYEKAFEACPNLQAGSRILAECYGRSGRDWGKSFSCYYSGNFTTGYRHGYVQKIYASMRQTAPGAATAPQGLAIPVVSKPARRTVEVSRYPVYAAPPAGVLSGPPRPSRAQSRIIVNEAPAPLLPVAAVPAPAAVIGMPQEGPVLLAPANSNPVVVTATSASPRPPLAAEQAAPAVDEAFVF